MVARNWEKFLSCFAACGLMLFAGAQDVRADLTEAATFQGNVGLSVDAVGNNVSPVGQLLAEIPVGATVVQAYLYAAGTPSPYFVDSPASLAEYNVAGISLAGNPVTNFSKLVGAVSDRPEIGQWFTGRADVTSIVQSLVAANPLAASHSWAFAEGASYNNRIDGGVLAVVFEHASLPESSVVLLDGGQRTGGETSVFAFNEPLPDPNVASFFLNMSIGISFSCCGTQVSAIDVNGERLTSAAGGSNDGALDVDGSLITAGGVGDNNSNPADPFETNQSTDDEYYDLRPFVSQGDNVLSVFSRNESNDDNIFFLGLHATAIVNAIPEPSTLTMSFLLMSAVAVHVRKRR